MLYPLQGLHLLLLSIRECDRFLRCNGHNVLKLAHTRSIRNARNSRYALVRALSRFREFGQRDEWKDCSSASH